MALFITCEANKYLPEAKALCERTGAALLSDPGEAGKEDLVLRFREEGLSLHCGALSMQGDFRSMLPRVKNGMWRHELLARAAKFKEPHENPVAIDATAGMGEDSLILASAGYEVLMFEYDPVIAALLRDTLRRAEAIPELKDPVGRMKLLETDSITGMKDLTASPAVIYLDPMFPARQKSGLIKKKFQLLQKLERPCSDGELLLSAAKNLHPERIIIKRPAKGPYLSGEKPDYSIEGGAIRFDCITRKNVSYV